MQSFCPMKKIASVALALVSLVGCQTADSKHEDGGGKKRDSAATQLGGEWVAPGGADEYLLFKPDEMEPRSGRFSGFGKFDRYEIKGRLSFGRHLPVELVSASEGSEGALRVSIDLSADGRSLVLTAPSEAGRKAPLVRTYRKVAH